MREGKGRKRKVKSDSKAQYNTAHYSAVQYSTVQYSTVQYSTVQYSTVQYSTVQCREFMNDILQRQDKRILTYGDRNQIMTKGATQNKKKS